MGDTTKTSLEEFKQVVNRCRELFSKKMMDYGSAWRILRLSSLTDQIYIKINRIRTIQQIKEQKVSDSITDEFIGILNYAVISLIQIELGVSDKADLNLDSALEYYDRVIEDAINLFKIKNHDYGQAWRKMRVSSITDLILQKVFRIKQIEDNKGKLRVSEGLEANYLDILIYSIFCLILGQEK